MTIRNSQFGVPKSADELGLSDPISVLYGVTPSNKFIPLRVDSMGRMELASGISITLDSDNIDIGEVVVKGVDPDNLNSEERVAVSDLGFGNGFALRTSVFFGSNELLVDASGRASVSIDNVAGTVPVSGTVTANVGTTGGLALDSTLGGVLTTSAFQARINTLGQKASASSTPVVIASDQSALAVSQSGAWAVSVSSSALPVGAATESTLSLVEGHLQNFDVDLSTRASESTLSAVNVKLTDGTQKTQLVDGGGSVVGVTSNALDVNVKSGITLNVNLDNADDDVLIYGSDGAINRAVKTDTTGQLQVGVTSSVLPAGAATQATLASVDGSLFSIDSKLNSLGQKIMASSVPVVLASDQSAVPITDNSGSLTVDGTIAATQSGTWTVQPGNTANTTPWLATINQGGNSAAVTVANALKVDGSAVTQPVSGVVTASFAQSAMDLFGRQRVAAPQSLFSSQFARDKQALFWDELLATGGTATFNTSQVCVDMVVTTSSGSRVVRQSKEYFTYEPGRAHQGAFTGVFGTATANCVQRVGLFDDNDGCFFQLNGTSFGVVIRSSVSGSPVNTTISQASFNLDKLDGTGSSGMTIDLTKAQLLFIEYQWFGVGTVRFGVFYNGSIVYCHQVHHSNLDSTVYMKTGSLPVRYEIVNTGSIGAGVTFKQICCAVVSEAGYTPQGVLRAADTGIVGRTAVSGTPLPLISIRLKSTAIRATIIADALTVMASTADNVRYRLILNPTLTGAAFASVDTNSVAEVDVAATSFTGGTTLFSGYFSNQLRTNLVSDQDQLLKLVSNIAGTSDIITISAEAAPAGNATVFGSIEWREYT